MASLQFLIALVSFENATVFSVASVETSIILGWESCLHQMESLGFPLNCVDNLANKINSQSISKGGMASEALLFFFFFFGGGGGGQLSEN